MHTHCHKIQETRKSSLGVQLGCLKNDTGKSLLGVQLSCLKNDTGKSSLGLLFWLTEERYLHWLCRKNDTAFIRLHQSYSTAALYVHWPYCKRRCTYCNFNKYIEKSVDHERMRQCLIKECRTLIQLSGVQKITSIFFGGGTPSLAQPETIKCLLDSINKEINLPAQTEISMEVNPTSVEMNNLKEFRDAGVNRVSIGMQTLNEQGLSVLGRDHSAKESLKCLEMAKHLFPGHVSLDLIYGWPGQTLEMWLSEIHKILQVCDDHISLYQLTLERGTQMFKLIQDKKLKLPEPEATEDMYLQAVNLFELNEYDRYEVSNFAKKLCYSQHNLAYWTGQDYIGVGPGAHGRFTPTDKNQREARIQTLEPNNWMWEVEHFHHATRKRTPLTCYNQLEELLAVGLRTKYGVSNLAWSKISPDKSIRDLLLHRPKIVFYIQSGLLTYDERGLKATKEGMNVVDSILPDLLVALAEGIGSVVNNTNTK